MAVASRTGDSATSASAPTTLSKIELEDDVPVGDRLVEHVEHRHAADIGIGARPEAQLVGMCAASRMSIGSTHSLRSICEQALLGGDRQGEDDEVDPRVAGEVDEVVDVAELRVAADDVGRAVVVAVVEDAADAQIGVVSARRARSSRVSPAAPPPDDDGAPVEPPARASCGG